MSSPIENSPFPPSTLHRSFARHAKDRIFRLFQAEIIVIIVINAVDRVRLRSEITPLGILTHY